MSEVPKRSNVRDINRARNAQRVKRNKKRRKGYLFTFLLLLVVLGSVVLSIALFFNVGEVSVSGLNNMYTPKEIIKSSGITIGENLVTLDTEVVRSKILNKYSYIEDVTVNRKLPDKVEIIVEMVKIRGVAEYGNSYMYVSGNGKIVGETKVPDFNKQPLLYGLDVGDKQEGDVFPKETFDCYRKVILQLKEQEYKNVTIIDCQDELEIVVVLGDEILVQLGNVTQLDAKLRFVKKVVDENLGKDESGIIIARNAEEIRFVPKPDTKFTTENYKKEVSETEPDNKEDNVEQQEN